MPHASTRTSTGGPSRHVVSRRSTPVVMSLDAQWHDLMWSGRKQLEFGVAS